jgi:hypothetical protein
MKPLQFIENRCPANRLKPLQREQTDPSNASDAKLHLLGRVLVEVRRRKSETQSGQGNLNFDPGTYQKGSRREQRAVPRRRATDPKGNREIDQPKKTRPKGFIIPSQGTRNSDKTSRVVKKALKRAGKEAEAAAKKAGEAAADQVAKGRPKVLGGRDVGRLGTSYAVNNWLGTKARAGIKPIKLQRNKPRKQNQHTATSPL